MRFLSIALILSALSACTPTVIAANSAGGLVAHVTTVGPFEDTAEAHALADANCRRYGEAAWLNDPISALDGNDKTLAFDCVTPPRQVSGY